jgi:hypothetical protein
VLQIMSELQDLCVSPALPLSLEHMKVDLSATLSLPERPVVTSSPVPPPTTHNPDALLAKELCDLLSGLETAIPRLGRTIACLLTGTSIKDKIKKVGVSLGPPCRKRSLSGANTRRVVPQERRP